MSRPNYLEQTENRVNSFEAGKVFLASDFADIADSKTIHMCFTRLIGEGKIKKIMRGIYMKSRYSTLLSEEIPPRVDDIAKAIARNYGWNI